MTNHKLTVEGKYSKCRKVLAAIAEGAVDSDEDDIEMDAITICNILDGQDNQDNGRGDNSATAFRALGDTIRNTLLEIHQIREQNRERRHKELLDVLSKVINNETHLIVKTPHYPCETDNHAERQEYLSDHCIVEEATNETTQNKYSIGRTEKNVGKTSSVNIFRKQESQTKASCNPKLNTEMIVSAKRDSYSILDLQLMRAKMLEMQRRKMEDRVRKKRNSIQVKKTLDV